MSPCPCAPRYSLLALLTCALEVLVRVPVLASVIMGMPARAVIVRVRGRRGARGGKVVDELDVHRGRWRRDEGRGDGGSAARSQIVGAYLIAAASSAAGHEFATWL